MVVNKTVDQNKSWELKERQKLPLVTKVDMAKERIKEWYDHYEGNVYVSFSGGKDSTVLLHLVRSLYPEVPAVFVDTGLEYPEVKAVVNKFKNVVKYRPDKSFQQVIAEYGWPVVSKRISQYVRERHRSSIMKNLLNGPEGPPFHFWVKLP